MDKVAESNFMVWVAGFLGPYDLTLHQQPRFIEELLSIIAKILYYDLNKQVNQRENFNLTFSQRKDQR